MYSWLWLVMNWFQIHVLLSCQSLGDFVISYLCIIKTFAERQQQQLQRLFKKGLTVPKGWLMKSEPCKSWSSKHTPSCLAEASYTPRIWSDMRGWYTSNTCRYHRYFPEGKYWANSASSLSNIYCINARKWLSLTSLLFKKASNDLARRRAFW